MFIFADGETDRMNQNAKSIKNNHSNTTNQIVNLFKGAMI